MSVMEQVEQKRVTLRDIARELDISHATVSLALRDCERISKETRELVAKKADEMGYFQNPMLAALSHYRTHQKNNPQHMTIAWVNGSTQPLANHPCALFRLYWKGAVQSARQLGFRLEEVLAPDASPDELDLLLKNALIHGLIYAPFMNACYSERLVRFPWSDYSVIQLGNRGGDISKNSVIECQVSNAVAAFHEIKKKGYERIGYVDCREEGSLSLAGFLSCQYELAPEVQLSPLLLQRGETGRAKQLLRRWLEVQRPEVILTDFPALPSLLEGVRNEYSADVSVVSLNIHAVPAERGIDPDPEEMGAVAVRALVSLLNECHFGIPALRSALLVKGRWVEEALC